jgi:hypothetical protein
MKASFKHAIVATLVATAGLAAFAQGMGGPMGGPPQQGMSMGMHRMDPAKMQERMAKHQAALKAKLKLTAEQEGAWTSFTSTMKPPAQMAERPNWKEIQALTTPERIDKMRALRTAHQAETDKRADAVKVFYAALNPEQKKVFDSEHLSGRHMRHEGAMGMGMMRGEHKMP